MAELRVSQQAPDFTLKDVDGNNFQLYTSMSAEAPTVVTFFRGAW